MGSDVLTCLVKLGQRKLQRSNPAPFVLVLLLLACSDGREPSRIRGSVLHARMDACFVCACFSVGKGCRLVSFFVVFLSLFLGSDGGRLSVTNVSLSPRN